MTRRRLFWWTVLVLTWMPLLALFIINARDGCYPWSPAFVDYHDNMTLCPGQSVRVPITFSPKPKNSGI